MSVLVKISPDLQRWISHNLERGCAPDALIGAMVEQRFEPAIARGVVDAFVRARVAGISPPDGEVALAEVMFDYEYEAPRLAHGNAIAAGDRVVRVLTRLEQPCVVALEEVLSAAECDAVIELARPRLQPSTVVDPATGRNTIADYRNSEGMFFALRETPLIQQLDERISRLMNCPVENGEGLQVLRYGPGGHSAPHFDFLIPGNRTNVASIERSGQRISSLVVYLNDVEKGGETVFPEAGLSVTPRRGNAVYFEYANSRGQLDQRSLHAGAAVIAGEKWVLTKWMRSRRFVAGSSSDAR